MAPFGRNFLKARLKNRTKDAEPVVGKEIQVTVCNEEKVVCGVTKHTTCADMIQALLEDHKTLPESKRLMYGEPKDFCLVERWKGFERALPPLTRILRLWYAWGDQRPFIQFMLVKTSDFVPHTAKKVGKYKGMKPKRWDPNPAHTHPLPADKQQRLVKKAFRKLEKLHKESRSSPGAEEVKRMVQLILNQDHTIREQIQRMRDVDLEIEQFEVEMQKQTNFEMSLPPACDQSLAAHSKEQLEKYLYTSDGVEQLDLQIQMHQEFILQLSLDIHAELKSSDFLVQDEQKGATAAPQLPFETDEFYTADLERLQEELRRSLFSGVALQNQAAEIDKQLKSADCSLVAKEQECWQLASQLNSIQIMDCVQEQLNSIQIMDRVQEQLNSIQIMDRVQEQLNSIQIMDRVQEQLNSIQIMDCVQEQLNSIQIMDRVQEQTPVLVPLKSEAQCGVSAAATPKRCLSPLDVTDTDSDTGISSTHSQDSLSPNLDFPSPLDSDV